MFDRDQPVTEEELHAYVDGELAPSGAGLHDLSAKPQISFASAVVGNELPQLIDDGERVEIAFALRIAPREQSVAAEYDAIAIRILFQGALHNRDKHRIVEDLGNLAGVLVEILRGANDVPLGRQCFIVFEGGINSSL